MIASFDDSCLSNCIAESCYKACSWVFFELFILHNDSYFAGRSFSINCVYVFVGV